MVCLTFRAHLSYHPTIQRPWYKEAVLKPQMTGSTLANIAPKAYRAAITFPFMSYAQTYSRSKTKLIRMPASRSTLKDTVKIKVMFSGEVE